MVRSDGPAIGSPGRRARGAIVAIEEDDRVRLTTNIVNCDPADVHVGVFLFTAAR